MQREVVYSFDANLLKGAGDSRGEEGGLCCMAIWSLWHLDSFGGRCACHVLCVVGIIGSASGDNSDSVPKNCAEYHGDTAIIFF